MLPLHTAPQSLHPLEAYRGRYTQEPASSTHSPAPSHKLLSSFPNSKHKLPPLACLTPLDKIYTAYQRRYS